MSILVKGMEMPRNCDRCNVCDYEQGCCLVFGEGERGTGGKKDGRMEWCPLVEIPPHGRLIDADALDKRIEEGGCCCTEEYAEWMGECIDNAPTIIEAEE